MVWTVSDLLGIGEIGSTMTLMELLAVGIAVLIVAHVLRRPWLRPMGLTVILAVYVAAHAILLGIQVLAALVFVVLLITHVELRILADRFARLYEAALSAADWARLRAALGRAVLRLATAAILAVVVPLFAADLAVAGVVPLTTIPSAILLAAGLVAVILALAILPSLRGRGAYSSGRTERGAKDN